MNGELIPSIQAGHLPVGILPVPPDAPDPDEGDGSHSDDPLFEVKDLVSAVDFGPAFSPASEFRRKQQSYCRWFAPCPCVGGVQDKIRVPALAGQELTDDLLQPAVAGATVIYNRVSGCGAATAR